MDRIINPTSRDQVVDYVSFLAYVNWLASEEGRGRTGQTAGHLKADGRPVGRRSARADPGSGGTGLQVRLPTLVYRFGLASLWTR